MYYRGKSFGTVANQRQTFYEDHFTFKETVKDNNEHGETEPPTLDQGNPYSTNFLTKIFIDLPQKYTVASQTLNSNISANSKILYDSSQGPRWVRYIKNRR
jgi:hypothetical protein